MQLKLEKSGHFSLGMNAGDAQSITGANMYGLILI